MSNVAFARKESAAPLADKPAARTAPSSLRIGEPNDAYEREADRIADGVMAGGMTRDWSLATMSLGAPLQRKCSCGGSCGASGECEECKKKKEEKTVQRKGTGAAGPEFAPPIVHEVLRSPGQSLDKATRDFFEPRFGYDFSGVRLHRGQREGASARAVRAHAYTVGQHIVVGNSIPSPQSPAGAGILAHELAHTVQQGSGAFDTGVQRLQRISADATAIPPGMTCVTDPSPGSGAELSLTGVKLTGGLNADQKKDIKRFYEMWAAAGGKEFIAVEGYASPDTANDSASQQKANWGYSCKRAELVQAEFIKLGVPRSRVITFAHGETDKFSPTGKDPDPNRRVEISRVRVVGPGEATNTAQPVQGPSSAKVDGKTDGQQTQVTVKPNPVPQPLPPVPEAKAEPEEKERALSVTFEFDLKNDWKSPTPASPTQNPPFLCDHGIYQLGLKWNNGIVLKKDRLEILNEPELDINVGDPLCAQNPAITAQVNLIKFTILKDLIESDLVGVAGLPDGWATHLQNFPFTTGAQVKLQVNPFARLDPDFKSIKIGAYGGLGFEQGVEIPTVGEEKRSRVLTFGGFVGFDYDVGPVVKKKKEESK